jgi:hypothetical protein
MKITPHVFFICMLFSCANETYNDTAENHTLDSLKSELLSRDNAINSLEFDIENNDSIVNQYALYINKIKENIGEINIQEGIINNAKNKEEINVIDTNEIVNAIKLLSSKLIENEKMISELNVAVLNEKFKNSQFEASVNNLNEIVAKSNREVYFLKEELFRINASFEAIFDKYNQQTKKINLLNSKLNEVAYAIGTKSELLENGVLTKGGGLIGIGKSRKLNDDLNIEYFTFNSRLELNSVILGFKSVKLITSHPTGTYQLHRKTKDKIDYLEITDNNGFWRNSKFLVIEVK